MTVWILVLFLVLVVGMSRPLAGEMANNLGYIALVADDALAAHRWFDISLNWTSDLPARRGRLRSELLLDHFDIAGGLFSEICSPNDAVLPLWLLRKAEQALELGDSARAVDTLDVLTRCDQIQQPELWYQVGEVYEGAGAGDRAEYAYRAGIARDPAGHLAKGWYYLGRLYYLKEDWQGTVNIIAPVVSTASDSVLIEPKWRESLLILANSLRSLGRPEEADQVYWRLIGLDPDARDWIMHFALIAAGGVEVGRTEFGAAAVHFVGAYDITVGLPEDYRDAYEERAWQVLSMLVNQVVKSQRLDELTRQTQRLVDEFPESPGWRVLLGLLYEKGYRRMDEACAAYAAARSLAPQSFYLSLQLERVRSKVMDCYPFNGAR